MVTILQISRFDNEYQVAIMPEGRVVHYLDRTKVPPGIRESIIKKVESLSERAFYAGTSEEESTGALEAQLSSIGRQVYRAFIPATAREALSYLHGIGIKNLEIATNDNEMPWYLMHDGEDFLCLKYVVGRTIQTNASFPLREAESKGRIDILFISDPTEDLPSARREVSRIMENVRSDFVAVDVLEGKDATIGRLMELLMLKEHERLEVLHFAGHVEYNKEKPEESSILLHEGKVTAKYLHDLIEAPPVLVFMNACSSARESEVSYSERQGQLTGLASAFIKAGVGAYIGTSWPVVDEPAADLAIEFYKGLHDGKSMGAALRDAQENLLKSRGPLDLTWAAFTLFGDPRLSFPFSECWTCGKRFMMEKKYFCEKCELYRCPGCGSCGCSLSEETRKIVNFALEASRRARSE